MAFGRLERPSGAQPMSEINMTPLIDVMLVLLVIFILTTPLMVSSLKVNLPQAQGLKAESAPKFIALTLSADGRMYLNDQALDPLATQRALAAAAQRDPDTEVRLRADATVPYGRVVELMGWARKVGLNRIGFVAEPQAPGASP